MNKKDYSSLFLRELREQADRLDVLPIAEVVLSDQRFYRWSASSRPGIHHYGDYGLIIHTKEVVDLCFVNANYFLGTHDIDEKKLFLAALFHDAGKMWDYYFIMDERGDLTWYSTDHKYKVHHISRSALLWNETKAKFGFEDENDEVLHAILAHHGLREWGSPVGPRTRIAWLLHLSDGISARLNDCDTLHTHEKPSHI